MTAFTEALAQRIADVQLAEVAPADVERARHCVLDWLCATIVGASSGPAVAVRAALGDSGDEATILGTGRRATARDAALANGVAAHALELDDVARAMRGHPGASVCSAAFALAESRDATGSDLIPALLAGYDTACRISLALAPAHAGAGWHATGTIGSFGAAAACARLLQLPPERTCVALGLAATQAAGLNASIGTSAKSLHAGKAAADGILAALLAAEGATAAADGVAAYAAAAAGELAPAHGEGQGDTQGIRSVVFKRHACCGVAQPALDAMQALLKEHRADPAAIASVEVAAPPRVLTICPYGAPADDLQARFSLPFVTALAWSGRSTGPEAFTADTIHDPELAERLARVSVAEHRQPSTAVTVILMDGRRLERVEEPEEPARDEELPAQWERLAGKLRALATPVVGGAAVEDVVRAVAAFDGTTAVADLLAPVTTGARATRSSAARASAATAGAP